MLDFLGAASVPGILVGLAQLIQYDALLGAEQPEIPVGDMLRVLQDRHRFRVSAVAQIDSSETAIGIDQYRRDFAVRVDQALDPSQIAAFGRIELS